MQESDKEMTFWNNYADSFQYAHVWAFINYLIKIGKYDEYLGIKDD